MRKSYFKLKFNEFKDKFSSFFVHRKKVQALENYREAVDFPGAKYIPILNEILKDGFLDQEEESFLNYQIKKAEICAYTWAHKTKWVKSEIVRMKFHTPRKPDKQIYFDFDKQKSVQGVPLEILGKENSGKRISLR